FIPVKVDRDERPDIDKRYQTAVGALTGQGGWPLTAFLTEEGRVFYGGTYFPPEDMHGRPGFKTVLRRIGEIYASDKEKALENARKIRQHVEQLAAPTDGTFELVPQAVEAAVQTIGKSFDIVNGGFGNAPKFPHTSAIELILSRYYETREEWLLLIAQKTLEKMARGGVYDQLGGGFHRYSVDEKWIVPHFEKMSYDNSELLKNYLHGYQATDAPLFRKVAGGIIGYVTEGASDTERGGFYASQDADIDMHDDGDYFTWTLDEVKETLPPEEAEVIALYYNVEPKGEMHHNPAKNVLFVDMEPRAIADQLGKGETEVEELLVRSKEALLKARAQRPMPFIDRTIYANWNGMMASAFVEAYKVLGTEACKDQALRTIDRLLSEAYVPGRGFYHSLVDGQARIDGLLDDQVQMARALLDAHEVTAEVKYLDIARQVMDYAIESFWDEAHGGFFDIARGKEASVGLEVPDKPIQDSPTPASNAVAVLVMDRLYHLTQRQEYRDKAEQTLKAFGQRCSQYGIFAATYFLALDQHVAPPAHAVIVGAKDDQRTQALWRKALSTYRPKKLVSLHDPAERDEEGLPPALLGMLQRSQEPLAYVCAGNACATPTADPAQLEATLKSFGLDATSS
ncbi:MAG: thioredoxin domain-containing protein, partial [Dehalococcoidia bacterium]